MKFVGLQTLVKKEIKRFMRIWTQTLLPPVITMSLYFLIFGAFIGSQIGDIDGVTYLAFILPGLAMMSVITNSFSNVASSFFGAKFQNSIEELLVSPMPNIQVLLGYVIGGMARGLLVGVLVTIIGMLFTSITLHNIPLIFIFVLLTSLVFSLAGFANGLFAKKFDDISIIPTFVLTPLTYLGGVFYSIKVLPEFWQTISLLNPVLYMVNGFRYGFLGVSDIPVHIGLIILTTFTVVFFLINLHLLNKGYGLKE